jgi:hypothetical protein
MHNGTTTVAAFDVTLTTKTGGHRAVTMTMTSTIADHPADTPAITTKIITATRR